MHMNLETLGRHDVELPTEHPGDQRRNGYYRQSPALLAAYHHVVAYRNPDEHELIDVDRWITVRVFESPRPDASRTHASVWINAPGFDCSGQGSASGHGYSREAAAIDSAFADAGIVIVPNIECYGHDAARWGCGLVAHRIGEVRGVTIIGHEFCS
jgi:hypothetical protein